jgi:hypothetical protein
MMIPWLQEQPMQRSTVYAYYYINVAKRVFFLIV